MSRQPTEILPQSWVPRWLVIRGHLGLQGKTTALLLAVIFAIGACAMALQLQDAERVMYGAQLTYANGLAATLAVTVTPHLAANDRPALARLCSRLIRERPTLHAVSISVGGEVISAARRGGSLFEPPSEDSNALPPPARQTSSRFSRNPQTGLVFAEVSYPIPALTTEGTSQAGEPLGYIRLVLDASAAQAAILIIGQHLLWLTAGIAIVMVPLMFLIVRGIISPLNQMTAAARRFAQDDLSARLSVEGKDEIAELGRALNTMADGLTASRNEMIAFGAELGRQVQQRTRELRELAAKDPLTNLYNRRHFSEAMTCEFAASVRYHKDLSLMMIDLDDFKSVNDNHGHHVGDEVLLITAQIIREELRAADIAARYGGDEFIVLLPHTPDADAEALAGRIRESLSRRAAEALPHIPVDVSIGIASLCATDATSPDDLIRAVDKALYFVKRNGKGHIARASGTRLVPA